MNVSEFKAYIRDKKVAVAGAGISNTPLIKYLFAMGVKVSVFDKNENSNTKELEKMGVEVYTGDEYLKYIDAEIVYKSPGIRPDCPEFETLRRNGSVITSEMETFFDICPAKIFAVTGSDGKSTTTTLIYTMLKETGRVCHLGGNIGRPLIADIDNIKENDFVVLELSSFQLFTMKKSPQIAVITNITPNHLDYHTGMDEYIDAKKNIYRFQNKSDVFVLNKDDEISRNFIKEARGEVVYFSKNPQDEGIYLKDEAIYYGSERILDLKDILIPGMFNAQNYMAAIAAAYKYVSKDIIVKVAKTFKGVEHRCEFIRELDGVKYYNSSIDSSPNRTMNTLTIFKDKIILIAGGKDKGIPYDELGPSIKEKVKTLILIGSTAPLIEKAALNAGYNLDIIKCASYGEVVAAVRKAAKNGDTALLSPASTSFDMFSNFEERGNTFKNMVLSL